MTQNSGFSQAQIGDFTGTLIDLSQYFKDTNVPLTAGTVDTTTLQPGATVPPTTRVIRAQIISDVTINFYFDLAVWYVLEQIIGMRGGSPVRLNTGNNAAPVPGDILFQGTMTLFSAVISGQTKADLMIACNWKPTDGGLIVPAITRY